MRRWTGRRGRKRPLARPPTFTTSRDTPGGPTTVTTPSTAATTYSRSDSDNVTAAARRRWRHATAKSTTSSTNASPASRARWRRGRVGGGPISGRLLAILTSCGGRRDTGETEELPLEIVRRKHGPGQTPYDVQFEDGKLRSK